LWRARCRDDRHAGFGRRLGETHRSKHRQGAPSRPHSRTSHQGISPGWIDVYTAKLSGQWLRLPGGSGPQLLCLDLAADPLRRIAETNETDNATSVAIRVSGTTVRRVDSGRCG
jgi:hypothetical protein